MPSSKPQPRSNAVDTDAAAADLPPESALLAAGRFFAARGVYGLVWIDPDLTVCRCFGDKSAFITPGLPLTDSVFPLIGSEEFIASFQSDPSLSLELPGVVIVSGPDTQDRYNLSLFWSPELQQYLLLIARASLDATLEIELLRHVRARLMAEADTRSKSDALARANRDLENFAAIISHDLKAPMRALRYMADDVRAALDTGRLDDVSRQLTWITQQSQRMSSMLSGLLDYSSIGRKSQAIEPVDTGALVHAIIASLPRRAAFTLRAEGEWPVIDTLKAPLDLVIRNLAENAIKHHDREDGQVVIAGRVLGGDRLLIEVRDDGPGIPPAHRETVFLPFRTLAVPDETAPTIADEGVGLGLALVRRSVESVGGSIQILPVPDGARGTTFCVTWPLRIDPIRLQN
jgi:signal transduction histidine kinase